MSESGTRIVNLGARTIKPNDTVTLCGRCSGPFMVKELIYDTDADRSALRVERMFVARLGPMTWGWSDGEYRAYSEQRIWEVEREITSQTNVPVEEKRQVLVIFRNMTDKPIVVSRRQRRGASNTGQGK